MIVVRRQFQQHLVAKIRVWRDMTGNGIGYDFEYTMRAAAVHFGFSTDNTGYWNTGYRTLSTVSVHIIIHYRRLRRPGFAVLVPFPGVYSP